MDRQDQIHAFSLAAHRLAVERLRENPARIAEAADVIERWRRQTGGPTHCEPYRVEWEDLLRRGVDAVEHAVCVDTDHAATLRSVSPPGRFITPAECTLLLRRARHAA